MLYAPALINRAIAAPMQPQAMQPGFERFMRSLTTFMLQRGTPWPEMRRLEVPGPGGPIETWIVSPANAGDGAKRDQVKQDAQVGCG